MHQLFIILICGLVTITNAKSPHVFSVNDSPLHTIRSSGHITTVTSKELHSLKRLSLRRLVLETSAVREPHWHANANELTYCLRGSALVTIFGNLGEHATFTISEGEMFFVPSGYLHHIENLNPSNETSTAEFISAFTHELPEDFGLSSAFNAMTDAVLGNTFQLPSSAWKNILKRGGEETAIGKIDTKTNIDVKEMYLYPNKYKFAIEKMSPLLDIPEGVARIASKKNWPILDSVSMISLHISTTGMREPHWHPKTSEMGYVVHGDVRMTILSPDGNNRLDTYTLKPGDIYFVPRAYPHHIENIGQDEVKMLVFFDQSIDGDIGFTGSFSAYSREVLAATFQCSPSQLPNVPFYPKDLLIVKRINPVDP